MIDSIQSPYIHTSNRDNFQEMVIENSHRGPILVNFWSKKSGPCLRQYPLLDKLVHDHAGKLLLVNIDTKTEAFIPREYGITSVPTLKLFRFGQVIETAYGYQSETELQVLVSKHVARPSDEVLNKAIEQYSQGLQELAYSMITEAIIEDPENPRLPVAICKLLKHDGRNKDALALIESLPKDIRQYLEIEQLENELSFLAVTDEFDDPDLLIQQHSADPDNMVLLRQLSAHYTLTQEHDKALMLMDKMMDQDPTFEQHFPRKSMLRIFQLLGSEHELSKQYRPSLRKFTH